MRYENGEKYLLASQLIELLATLPPDCEIMPNRVGNLSVYFPDGSWSMIDFLPDGGCMEPPMFFYASPSDQS
jgi:hypothetical protein